MRRRWRLASGAGASFGDVLPGAGFSLDAAGDSLEPVPVPAPVPVPVPVPVPASVSVDPSVLSPVPVVVEPLGSVGGSVLLVMPEPMKLPTLPSKPEECRQIRQKK